MPLSRTASLLGAALIALAIPFAPAALAQDPEDPDTVLVLVGETSVDLCADLSLDLDALAELEGLEAGVLDAALFELGDGVEAGAEVLARLRLDCPGVEPEPTETPTPTVTPTPTPTTTAPRVLPDDTDDDEQVTLRPRGGVDTGGGPALP